jgi:hypothetical protein
MERHGLSAQIIVDALGRLQLGFLDDIRRIDPRPEFRVHPEFDDAPQIIPVAGQELIERTAITGANLLKQISDLSLAKSARNHATTLSLPARLDQLLTKKCQVEREK